MYDQDHENTTTQVCEIQGDKILVKTLGIYFYEAIALEICRCKEVKQ